MRIKSFKAKGLNGYLEFNLRLHDSRNFLIGINGSGKTTVLRAIMALLGPDLDWLINATFKSVSVDLIVGEDLLTISCESIEDGRKFSLKVGDGARQETRVSRAEYYAMVRQNTEMAFDDDGEIIRMQETSVDIPADNKVLHRIKKLPVPVFLGLDRSNLPLARISPVTRRRRMARRAHATLRSFLDESLGQAEYAASQARITAKVARDAKANQLREDMLLTLFAETNRGNLIPSKNDIKKFEKYRRSLKQAFSVLGLNKERVESTVDPFFTKLIDTGSALSGKEITKIVVGDSDPALRRSFNEWLELSPRLPLFGELEKLVSTFNDDEKNVFAETDAYLRIMNAFFTDSNKSLFFADDGSLQIKLPSGKPSTVQVLSSGERQLFVLITTLMFGEDLKSSVLIIDEPELSLHLKWQEMFVSSIVEANDNVQLIFATHSPSIILDHEEYCVDLA
jgi:energy-coupling factor transporter ATP-binding protein EcfA2